MTSQVCNIEGQEGWKVDRRENIKEKIAGQDIVKEKNFEDKKVEILTFIF